MELRQIAEGYFNLLLSGTPIANEKIEELAAQRLTLCNTCTFNGGPTLIDGKCSLCGCLMEAKSRAPQAKCPLNKW